MEPLLSEGQEVVLNPRQAPKEGDIVVAVHPFQSDTTLIKQVASFDASGRMILAGANPAESTDSRSFGGVPQSCLVGVVSSIL